MNRRATWFRRALAGAAMLAAGFMAEGTSTGAPPDAARLRQVVAKVDLSSLPIPGSAEDVEQSSVEVRFTASEAVEPTMAFLRRELEKAGWRELRENQMPQMTEQYAQAMFEREGCRLSVSLSAYEGKTMANLVNMGPFDTRQLPRVLAAKPLFESPFTTILVTDASVLDATTAVREALVKDGWRQFGTDRQQDPASEHQALEFCSGLVRVGAFVGVAPAQGGRTTIQYSTRLLSAELPWPEDAERIEFQDDMLRVWAVSPSSFGQVFDFYRDEMQRLGWILDAGWMMVGEQSADVAFGRPGGASRVRLQLTTTMDGTRIEMDGLPADAYRRLLAAARQANAPEEPMPAEEAGAQQVAGASVRALPLPAGAKQIEYDAQRSEVRFRVDAKPKELVKFYQERLSQAGWSEGDGVQVSTSVLAVAQMTGPANEEITATMMNPGLGGATEVTISVRGMAFEGGADADGPAEVGSEEPSHDEPSGDESPLQVENVSGALLPDNRTSLMSEGSKFRRTVHASTPSALPRVLDFYRRELAKAGWREQPGGQMTDNEAVLRFTGAEGSLQLTLRAGDETSIEYATKDPAAAKQAGILPKAGMAKVVFANMSDRALSVTLGGKPVKVGANVGVRKPDGPSFDLKPGKYTLKFDVPGGQSMSEVLELAADEAWGVMLDVQGPLVLPLF